MSQTLRIATRGSRLARWQTDHVVEQLVSRHPGLEVEIVEIKTTGDVITDVPLSKVASSAFFTREIETALLENRADIAVHSLKDLASTDVPGLRLGAVLEREDVRDALISIDGSTFEALAPGARIGTSSVRRRALIALLRPDLELAELRGNVPTRLKKLDEGQYDAIVLATAGLNRLGLGDRVSQHLDPRIFVPAAGQGAIAVQIREDDDVAADIVSTLQHPETRAAVDAERTFLAALSVGCQAPVGVHARIDGDQMEAWALAVAVDGSHRVEVGAAGPTDQAASVGRKLADAARERGAEELIAAARVTEDVG